jgi:ribosomal protein S18 acetylase RimI-like enzyme
MIAFDAPRRAVCIAKRERTDSPLQALILLNGTQYVEAARSLGEKLLQRAGGDVDAMVRDAFLLCVSRSPDAREIEIGRRLYREQLEYFRANPGDASALLKHGSSKPAAGIPAAEAAAATVLAQALLNHDLSIVKR